MKKNIILISLLLFVIIFEGCKSENEIQRQYSYYNLESICLGSDLDGSVNIKAWGTGQNKSEAIEQAKKNALKDVIFKGFTHGNNGANPLRPLIYEANAQTKYEYYFNAFFSKNGEYLNFIKAVNPTTDKSEGLSQKGHGVIVKIQRADLKTKLIEDKIIKP